VVTIETDVLRILDSVLSLQGRAVGWQRNTPLLGALPELDSMAVLGIITSLEEHFAFIIHDDEIDSADFATLGSLTDFVTAKLAA
jgi:acyl carrier protein